MEKSTNFAGFSREKSQNSQKNRTFGVNKTVLIAKISIKYVLPTCIWKHFRRISWYFAFFGEFCGILRKYLNFAGPRPREISEALLRVRSHHNAFQELKDLVLCNMLNIIILVVRKPYNICI